MIFIIMAEQTRCYDLPSDHQTTFTALIFQTPFSSYKATTECTLPVEMPTESVIKLTVTDHSLSL